MALGYANPLRTACAPRVSRSKALRAFPVSERKIPHRQHHGSANRALADGGLWRKAVVYIRCISPFTSKGAKMKQSALIYLATLVVAFPLDFLFLQAGGRLFGANVRELILDGLAPTALFFALYIACTVSFVNGATPHDWVANASRGALLGLLFFAAFDLASMALLRHWKWDVMLLPDIIWGAVLTALAASVGGFLAGWILTKI